MRQTRTGSLQIKEFNPPQNTDRVPRQSVRPVVSPSSIPAIRSKHASSGSDKQRKQAFLGEKLREDQDAVRAAKVAPREKQKRRGARREARRERRVRDRQTETAGNTRECPWSLTSSLLVGVTRSSKLGKARGIRRQRSLFLPYYPG